MNSIENQAAEPTTMQSSLANVKLPVFSDLTSQALTPTNSSPALETAVVSVSGARKPSSMATCIAAMQERDVTTVEAVIVSVREAYRRGDPAAVEDALIDQAVLLQELGLKFLKLAGSENTSFQRIETYTGLSLRAFDGSRKTFGMLAKKHAGPGNQTNVQVNVGAQSPTNEILQAPHE